jgi:hypothetical protein
VTGKKIKAKKMGIFVSTLRHNSDKKTVTENKIQNNMCGNMLVYSRRYLSTLGPLFSHPPSSS